MQEMFLILHNIRSAQNVGSMFRTADAAGVSRIYLCGYTPDPIDRFGRERSDIQKAALGAEKSIAWEHPDDVETLIQELKKKGVTVVALEQDTRAKSYKDIPKDTPVALIMGNEVEGVSQSVLDQCDMIAEIPMHGSKESLNVSVAAGIALFSLR